MALLPVQERDPVLQSSFTHMVESAQQRVVVLVGAPDWDRAKRAADAYVATVHTNPDLLEPLHLSDQTEANWLAQFSRNSLVLMTGQQETALRDMPAQYWRDTALNKMMSPFGGPKLGAWRDDPFGIFGEWIQERAQETPVRMRDGHLFVADSRNQYVVLPMTLRQSAFSMQAQQAVVQLLDLARIAAQQAAANPPPDQDLKPTPGSEAEHSSDTIQVITTGMVFHAAAASEQASGEVTTIGVGSLVGVILLMWLTFHSIKPIALILLSVGVGCLGALSVCWLVFGHIHLLTLVFGASLIGVAQDYGIYFLCHRLSAASTENSLDLLKRLLPGLALTLLAAVIGYTGLALTPFPGLRLMALFSALGLVFAWLTVVCWFPALIHADSLKSGMMVQKYSDWFVRLPRWQSGAGKKATQGFIPISAAIILLIAVVFGLMQLEVNDDIRLLQNSPKSLINDQILLSQLLDAPTPMQFYLVRGNSAESVLQREEILKKRLTPLIAQHVISGVQAMSSWVPSLRTQQDRMTLIKTRLLNPGGPLTQLALQLGEDAHWASVTANNLLTHSGQISVDTFLSTAASEPWRFLWLGQVRTRAENGMAINEFASIVALRGVKYADLPALQRMADGLDGVQWVDKINEISSVLKRFRQTMSWVVVVAYLVVFSLLLPRYRRSTWRVLAPTALASIATLAILGFGSQPVQLFHILAFMLLLGVGVDYGIFMQEQARLQDASAISDQPHRVDTLSRSTAWLAVGLSAANTILSFGLLGLSGTPALQAFGRTMLIGTILVWLFVPFFGKSATGKPVSTEPSTAPLPELPITAATLTSTPTSTSTPT